MRIIDADDLYRKVVGYNGGAVDKTVAKRLIEQQPTVQRNSTQSNASNTLNALNALDTIYRQAAIDVVKGIDSGFVKYIEELPSAQPTLYGYKIEHLAYIARVMEKEGVTADYAVRTFDDMSRVIKMIIDEIQQKVEEALNG